MSTCARSNHVRALGKRVAPSIIDLTFINIFVAWFTLIPCAVAKAGKIRAISELFAISTVGTGRRCTEIDVGAFEASSLPTWIAMAFVRA